MGSGGRGGGGSRILIPPWPSGPIAATGARPPVLEPKLSHSSHSSEGGDTLNNNLSQQRNKKVCIFFLKKEVHIL